MDVVIAGIVVVVVTGVLVAFVRSRALRPMSRPLPGEALDIDSGLSPHGPDHDGVGSFERWSDDAF